MFFRFLSGKTDSAEGAPTASEALQQLVQASMPAATPEQAAVVGAVAGLLAFVAYADRRYTDDEQRAVRAALSRVEGFPEHAAEAVSALLGERIKDLATEPVQTYTRVLVGLTSRVARVELLDVLMDLAAADELLSIDETHGLRRVTKLLGLSERDYDAAQAQHRHRLSVLR